MCFWKSTWDIIRSLFLNGLLEDKNWSISLYLSTRYLLLSAFFLNKWIIWLILREAKVYLFNFKKIVQCNRICFSNWFISETEWGRGQYSFSLFKFFQNFRVLLIHKLFLKDTALAWILQSTSRMNATPAFNFFLTKDVWVPLREVTFLLNSSLSRKPWKKKKLVGWVVCAYHLENLIQFRISWNSCKICNFQEKYEIQASVLKFAGATCLKKRKNGLVDGVL